MAWYSRSTRRRFVCNCQCVVSSRHFATAHRVAVRCHNNTSNPRAHSTAFQESPVPRKRGRSSVLPRSIASPINHHAPTAVSAAPDVRACTCVCHWVGCMSSCRGCCVHSRLRRRRCSCRWYGAMRVSQVVRDLVRCHEEHNIAKFWGKCNAAKDALDACFKVRVLTARGGVACFRGAGGAGGKHTAVAPPLSSTPRRYCGTEGEARPCRTKSPCWQRLLGQRSQRGQQGRCVMPVLRRRTVI